MECSGIGLIICVGEGVGRDSSGFWTADGQDSDGDGEVGRYVGMFLFFPPLPNMDSAVFRRDFFGVSAKEGEGVERKARVLLE